MSTRAPWTPWAPRLSSDSRLLRAVLDADVIFSRVLHELFGRLAHERRLYDLIWSDELIDEAVRALVERKPTEESVARRWVERLTDAFPDGRVDPPGHPPTWISRR